MTRLKVGILGCGHIVQCLHLNILARLPEVAIVALAELDVRRREAAQRHAPSAIGL